MMKNMKMLMAAWDDNEMKDLGGLEQGEQYPPLEIVNIILLVSRIIGLLMRGSQEIGLKKYKMR